MNLFKKKPIYKSEKRPKYPADKFDKYCPACGKEMVWTSDPDGYYVDTGEPKFYTWLHCPDYIGGQYKPFHISDPLSYQAARLSRDGKSLVRRNIGYTMYQTCDQRIIYDTRGD